MGDPNTGSRVIQPSQQRPLVRAWRPLRLCESHRLSDLHLISELGALCAFARGLVYPIFSLSRQACPEPFLCQDKLRRRDTKKTILILLLGVLCAFARVIVYPIP